VKKLSILTMICLFFTPFVYGETKTPHHKPIHSQKVHAHSSKTATKSVAKTEPVVSASTADAQEVGSLDINSDMTITVPTPEETAPPKPQEMTQQADSTPPAKPLETVISNKMTSEEEESSINIGHGMNLKTAVQTEENNELNATINISYPQITGQNLSENAKHFNQTMQDMVAREAQQFKNYVKADLPHMKTLLSENPQSNLRNDFQVDYDIDVIHPNHNTIVSVRFNTEGMQIGRAHPYHNHPVLNYDLNAGKALALENLFIANSNYLKMISGHARKQLLTKLPDKWMIEQGTKDPKNYQAWSLQKDSLLITFNEYQVAPYASGPQEIEIPYAELKKVIAPNSVISGCLGDSKNCG
jgi:hypothetical protein